MTSLSNKNQQDALFTYKLFQYLTSTFFEQAYCSSSGGTAVYIQQLVNVLRLCWLAVGRIGTELPTASQHKRMTYTNFCIYRKVFTLDAGLLARGQYSEGPATVHFDTGFLGFPVSISKCWDGSQDSKLPLHASHVALPT